jgi:uncharacterized protein YdeI (BOF family)
MFRILSKNHGNKSFYAHTLEVSRLAFHSTPMIKRTRQAFLSISWGLLALSGHAGASPAHPYHYTTVRWVVNTRDDLDMDDRYVTLIGHVTRHIDGEEYWFTDGTGSVRLDSEDFDLPVGKKVIIGGRIDQAYLGFGHLEVDVRHWRYAK